MSDFSEKFSKFWIKDYTNGVFESHLSGMVKEVTATKKIKK